MSTALSSRRSFMGSLAGLELAQGDASRRLYAFRMFKPRIGTHFVPRPQAIFLKALAASRMPAAAVLSPAAGPDPNAILLEACESSCQVELARILELRVYHAPGPYRLEIFRQNGIVPAFFSTTAYLIPFDGLASRARAWNVYNVRPERTHSEPSTSSVEISLWSPALYGF